LLESERRQAAVSPEDSEARRRVQILNQRIAHLQQSLHSAIVVQTPAPPWDRVRFGASVTVRDRSGREEYYRIVGADETDIDRGWVSCHSPLARALLNARVGERVRFRVPAGEEELEIVSITYD
jgi:transcription elongation factor GreB